MTLRRTLISFAAALAVVATAACDRTTPAATLRGDWDYYRMLGAEPSGGFDARRRFGFAHFEGADTTGAFINRRSGPRLERIRSLTVKGDSLVLELAGTTAIRAHIGKDTIAGQYYRDGAPTQRVWFVRRGASPDYEPNYALWPGKTSDSAFAVTIDPAVPMKTRDGITLMSFVGHPVGKPRNRDPRLLAFTVAGIIRSDLFFTIPGVVGILASGVGMALIRHLPILATGWGGRSRCSPFLAWPSCSASPPSSGGYVRWQRQERNPDRLTATIITGSRDSGNSGAVWPCSHRWRGLC